MKMKKIIIFDYGLGNLKSIFNAFSKVGADVSVTNNLRKLDNSFGMILPGVGSFSAAKQVLEEREFFMPLKKYLNRLCNFPTLVLQLNSIYQII